MRRVHDSAALRAPLVRMLAGGALCTASVGFLLAVALGVSRGPLAAASALGVSAVVVLFFATGVLGLRAVLGGGDPRATAAISLLGALVVYLGQLVLVTALAALVWDAAWIDHVAVAVAGLAAVVAWQVGQIAGFVTSRTLVFAGPAGAAT